MVTPAVISVFEAAVYHLMVAAGLLEGDSTTQLRVRVSPTLTVMSAGGVSIPIAEGDS